MRRPRALARAALTIASVALVVAPAIPTSAETARVYAFTRGSGYGVGDSELIVPTLFVPRGGTLTFVNLHVWGHSITSDEYAGPDVRLFRSDVVPFRRSSPVFGVADLAPGEYGFFCSNHMSMRGTIVVL